MRFSPSLSSQFKKDFKLCEKRHLPTKDLEAVMLTLLNDQPLAPKHKAHLLSGRLAGHWECHIRPNWLLIWVRNEEAGELHFVRTGTHSDLFD